MNKSLASKLIKASKSKNATMMNEAPLGDKVAVAQTFVPVLNLMLSGELDGGPCPGIVQIVGDSRTFKTSICLTAVKGYLDTYEDAVCVFFDCEFGAMGMVESLGIDPARIVYNPFEDLEDLKFQLVSMLDSINRGEHVIFFIDSISQVASKKEVQNAIQQNEAADLTRAREMNSFFRIITPKLNMREIPLFCVNSWYADTTNQYAEKIIKGGKQSFLSSDTILFVTRSQDKTEADGFMGWNFNYTMMKSRSIIEKSKFTINVKYDGGIQRWSGMFELATEGGFITCPTQGFYSINFPGFDGTAKHRKKALMAMDDMWEALVKHQPFKDWVSSRYKLMGRLNEDDTSETVDEETGEIIRE